MEKVILIPLSDTPEISYAADIIFVHGLMGDPHLTWQTGKDGQSCWAEWLNEERPDLCYWTLGYPVAASNWRGAAMALEDRALSVLDILKSKQIGRRPICFITHSMGGLLVKQLLKEAKTITKQYQHIADNVKAVVFISTPHSGSFIASFLKYWINFFIRASPAIEDLKAHHPGLRELQRWYANNSQNINTKVYFEMKKTGIFQIVNPTSANPGMGATCIPIDANHINICKPQTRDDQIYIGTLDFLAEAFPRPNSLRDENEAAFPHPSILGLEPAGGEIPLGKQPYIDRRCDQLACDLLRGVQFPFPIWIKGRNKTGKTSLLLRLLDQVKSTHETALIRFEEICITDSPSEYDFCQWFSRQISKQLRIDNDSPLLHRPQYISQLEDFLKSIILMSPKPVMLGFDNMDAILETTYFLSFLALIRTSYNNRSNDGENWNKISFVGSISHDHSYLVRHNQTSPFAIGKRITIENFTFKETSTLAEQFNMSDNDNYVRELHNLVGGHPYLLHKLFEAIAEGKRLEYVKLDACRRTGILEDHLNLIFREMERRPVVFDAFCRLSLDKAILLPDGIGHPLGRLGLASNEKGDYWKLSCPLYREFQSLFIKRGEHGASE